MAAPDRRRLSKPSQKPRRASNNGSSHEQDVPPGPNPEVDSRETNPHARGSGARTQGRLRDSDHASHAIARYTRTGLTQDSGRIPASNSGGGRAGTWHHR